MDFDLAAIALGDVTWITLAFLLGFLAKFINLPPLVGFLATGFVLNYLGVASGDTLQKLADLGITLLLFTVGLKLNLKVLIRPQVWSVASLHIAIITALFGLAIYGMALLSVPLFDGL
ncbi:MAG: cation:proton antiporter, partial [Gammaproteobacteria bacterium]